MYGSASTIRYLDNRRTNHTVEVYEKCEIPSENRIRLSNITHAIRQENRTVEEDRPTTQNFVWRPYTQDRHPTIHPDGRSSQQRNTRNNLQPQKRCLGRVPAPHKGTTRRIASGHCSNQAWIHCGLIRLWPTALRHDGGRRRRVFTQSLRQTRAGRDESKLLLD